MKQFARPHPGSGIRHHGRPHRARGQEHSRLPRTAGELQQVPPAQAMNRILRIELQIIPATESDPLRAVFAGGAFQEHTQDTGGESRSGATLLTGSRPQIGLAPGTVRNRRLAPLDARDRLVSP